MPDRNRYDLSHYSFMVGKVGRLMTLSAIPVVAGDSMGVNIAGAIRLSPLRRDLSLDAMIDLFAFFVPHRHVYGQTWIDFIREGVDENETLESVGLSSGDIAHYLGYNRLDDSVPLWLTSGYARIWNRYFRVPNGDVAEIPVSGADSLLQGQESRNYGQLCARLKTFPTTGNLGTDDSVDDSVYNAPVSGTGNGRTAAINLTTLDGLRAVHRSELEREWFGRRYTDVLERHWGGFANADADERPTLLMRESNWMSGYDVDGSGDANLGQYSGKAATVMDMNVPRRFFSEHGCYWIMALIRFPTIFEKEVHYLCRKANPHYTEISGDPEIIANNPPLTLPRWTLFSGTSSSDTTNLGRHPFGQWYRYHPSVVHGRFDELGGFPFMGTPADARNAQYIGPGDYDQMFATTQLGHWRSQMRVNCMVDRVVPGPLSSIYTGV